MSHLKKKTKRLKLVEVVFLLKEITNLEMDLRFEAAAANEYAENTKNDVGFRVTKIYWNYTSENVMTLDWVDGISIREKKELINKEFNTEKIAEDIIQNFLRHAVRDGFFHADMHQGNIFIDNDGQIVPIDFGIMGRLDKMSKRFLAEILFGFIQRDYRKVAEVHLIAGLVPKEVPIDDLAQALRSIGEPIFGQSVKDISDNPKDDAPQTNNLSNSKKPFGMGLGIGSASLDGAIYNQISLRPEINFGKLGVGFDLVFYIDNDGNFRQ